MMVEYSNIAVKLFLCDLRYLSIEFLPLHLRLHLHLCCILVHH